MFKRSLLLMCLAALTSAATASAASKPPKPPKNPPPGPTLTVKPFEGKPGTRITIVGKLFAPKKVTRVEMDCPIFGHTQSGQVKWAPRADAHGGFTINTKVLKLKKTKTSLCGIYALDVTARRSFYVSTSFKVL
jgi:hypothetical protein